MTANDLKDILEFGQERRNIDFKTSIPWNNRNKEFKAKITKTILGISNIRDGGNIIIGVDRNDDDSYTCTGLENNVLNTYTKDNIASFVDVYSDPYVNIDVFKLPYKNKSFAVIKVFEFNEIPVLCKKDYNPNNNIILKDGAVYTRSYRKPETIEVPSQSEMREILDMAVEKKLKKQLMIMENLGITQEQVSKSRKDEDKRKFEEKLKDIK